MTPPVAKSEKEIRLEKLKQLQARGVNPYPSVTPKFVPIAEARNRSVGEELAVVGRITRLRGHGKATFFDLEQEESSLQVYAKQDHLKDYDLLKLFDTGDYLWVKGELFQTHSGELTIQASNLELLSKALLPAANDWHGLSDVETRYRQRSLDFKTNKAARDVLKARSEIIKTIRHFLDNLGFLEVQTPILQPLAGGAAAKPFITKYNTLDADFYLRIAPELYLKRLVVGGFDRVYEIGASFRNEGLSHMHNPEFSSCEFYWAYQNYQGLMEVTEQLIEQIATKVTGGTTVEYQDQKINFKAPFKRVEFIDLIRDACGIDLTKHHDFESLTKAIESAKIKLETKPTVWSELADELYKKVARPKIVEPTFIYNYPAELSPLAKKRDDQPTQVEQFQLVLGGGFELVKAYSELNDPLEQEARFRDQLQMKEAGWDEAQLLDENFVEALKFGMPPTAGWGMGIERLTMLLTNQYSIKEVIAFPTLKPLK